MYNNELYHHGVLGMKWGIRRYQSYSTKPRGSGEGGKEIGAAKKSSKNTSQNKGSSYNFSGSSRNNHKSNGKKYVEKLLKSAGISLVTGASKELGKQLVLLAVRKAILHF